MSVTHLIYLLHAKQHHQRRDAYHGQQGGNERHLGNHRGVLLVLQTEDSTVCGNGHSDDQRIDIHHKRIETHDTH